MFLHKKKVAVGLSGGVDSSVAAHLLLKQGYDVTGVYMQCWDSKADGCTAEEDRASAVGVAAHLGIDFVHLDFISEYKEKVIKNFYSEYAAGRTPNPDILCNKEIKFGMFLNWALNNGFDFVATGHYAKIEEEDGIFKLLQAADVTKDQSYFLYRLNQRQLKKVLFPLGDLKKEYVREIAKSVNLPTFNRPDSVGICFIGDIDLKDFLKKELPEKEGFVYNVRGEIIGTHSGAHFLTIGQRHGFNIDKYQGIPMYVVSKDVEKNKITVGPVQEVLRQKFELEDLHWLYPIKMPSEVDELSVRIRHLGEMYKSKVEIKGKKVIVTLENKIFGVAPGQSAVIYDGDLVLGGGIISEEL